MSREISFLIAGKDGIENINYDIKEILGYKFGKSGGLKISGCGMDMGFAVVYELSGVIYNDSRKLKSEWI